MLYLFAELRTGFQLSTRYESTSRLTSLLLEVITLLRMNMVRKKTV